MALEIICEGIFGFRSALHFEADPSERVLSPTSAAKRAKTQIINYNCYFIVRTILSPVVRGVGVDEPADQNTGTLAPPTRLPALPSALPGKCILPFHPSLLSRGLRPPQGGRARGNKKAYLG